MSNGKRLLLFLVPLALFSLLPALLSAQEMGGKKDMSVTGCLKQGGEHGGFYLTGEDGKVYELFGHGLAAHVNHKVTVSGMEENLSSAMEQKREADEKKEAGSTSYTDMRVTHVKMVSDTCQ
jgi:hypothetical protein